MRYALRSFAFVLVLLTVSICSSFADSVDDHIKDLKSSDPEVRAKAAFELGCS